MANTTVASRTRQASDRLQYAALLGVVGLIRLLPMELAARLSGHAWRLLAPRLKRHRRAQRNLAAMLPELAPAERERILRDMWQGLGQTFVETLMLHRIAAEPGRIATTAASREALERTSREGAVVACPHLGNWEVSPILLAAIGGRHAAVYRSAKNRYVDAHLLALRLPYYRAGLFRKGHDAARSLIRCLRDGCSVGIMADLRDDLGCAVPFFGRDAPSTPMPAMLARQFARPLFASTMVRTGPVRFELHVVEIPVQVSSDRAADIRVTTERLHATFEAWIRQWPEQWMWAHQRYQR